MDKKFNCMISLAVFGLIFILLNLSGVTECVFIDRESSENNSFTAWAPDIWTQSNQSEFNSGVLFHTDTVSIPDSVRIQSAPDSYVYALRGDNSEDFWRYNPFTENWLAVNNSLRPVGAGGGLVYGGAGNIYAFRGNSSNEFWKYNLSNDTWHNLTFPPYNASLEGGSLAYDGASRIYAFMNDSLPGVCFLNYNISNGTWNLLPGPNSSYNVSLGGPFLACDGADSVYVLAAGPETHFLKYDISTNKWNYSLNATPFSAYYGTAIAYDGDRNSIYALKGNSTGSFWRYDIGNDTWNNLSDAPGNVEAGASLTYDGGRHVYAFQGNSTKSFWSYDLGSDSWQSLADTPGPISYGGSLAFVSDLAEEGGYYSGTLASRVMNTENNGTILNNLFRNETLEVGTNISFEVRANNTPFLKNASIPAWVAVEGSSPVTSVSGRYVQWRANLTTTNLSNSSILEEVRVYYTI